MREHREAGGVVHLGLEGVLVLQGECPHRRRAGADLGEMTLQVGKLLGRIRSQHKGDQARPAPDRHVDDAVGLAAHELVLAKPGLKDTPMTLGLEGVAVDGIFLGLRREVPEVNGLARVRTDARGHEHQPRQHLAPLLQRLAGQEFPAFFCQVKQDRIAVEDGGVAIDDDRNLGVGIDRQELRRVLLALARVDRE